MDNSQNSKPIYDLEERTFQFAKDVRNFVKKLPKTIANIEDTRPLVKASGSVGANYREANESLGKKDFLMRIKISRKESKESEYFLRLISGTNDLPNKDEASRLTQEATELKKYFLRFLKNLNKSCLKIEDLNLIIICHLYFEICHLTNRGSF
jgi:four helix bundle protein